MLENNKINQYKSLSAWFQTPLGHFIEHEFLLYLHALEINFKGEHLIQLGGQMDNSWLTKLDYRSKWIISTYESSEADLISDYANLPIAKQSVDCVVAPLTLEPLNFNHNLVDEIDRILKPMGYLILLSINPWSLWGTAMKLKLFNCYDNSHYALMSSLRVNRIFTQRGYKQIKLDSFCFIPPVNSSYWIKKLTVLEEIGKMLWPIPGNLYCYIGQKYLYQEPNRPIAHFFHDLSDYTAAQPIS